MDRVVSLPRHLSRTRNRWALGDLLESDERVPVRRFLRSHRPPPPRENRTRASSLADRHPRAPVFPIALARRSRSLFLRKLSARILETTSEKGAWPPTSATASVRSRLVNRKVENLVHSQFEKSTPRHPASQPAGANSRVTPVLGFESQSHDCSRWPDVFVEQTRVNEK